MILFAGDIDGDFATLWQEEIVHCTKVLRKKIGDEVYVTNGKGDAISGKIISSTKQEVKVKKENSIELPSQTVPLHIALALTKNIDRFEFFIEKATELGVEEITPIVGFHSERKKARIEKLQLKAVAASKQSLRARFLQVNEIQNLDDFLHSQNTDSLYIAHCYSDLSRTPIRDIDALQPSTILIGPEGDFSVQEVEKVVEDYSGTPISLGPNRLRTETAGIFVASYFYASKIIS